MIVNFLASANLRQKSRLLKPMRIFCCCTSEMKRVLKKHLKSD